MKLTNDSYTILIGTKNFTERYYRDQAGWLKVSARGRKFRATAEQVLNHLLPALAGVKPNLIVKVEHHAGLKVGAVHRTARGRLGSIAPT
ncbi:MAG: hypothetical protein QOE81_2097 [Verrucomicrobiota bacterium]|jgi:hypothetical protein